jgi:hypothetical protein
VMEWRNRLVLSTRVGGFAECAMGLSPRRFVKNTLLMPYINTHDGSGPFLSALRQYPQWSTCSVIGCCFLDQSCSVRRTVPMLAHGVRGAVVEG